MDRMTHEEVEFETMEVKRHGLFYRLCHWGIVSTFLIIGIMGLRIGSLYDFTFPTDLKLALYIHVYLGFIFTALWGPMLVYVLAHEWEWFSPTRFPYATKFAIQEALAWTHLGPHIEDPRGYDPEEEEYVEKLVPTEVTVLWMYLGLAGFMAVTGFSLYYPGLFAPLIGVADSIAPLIGVSDGDTLLSVMHRMGMYIFVTVVMMHVYAVVIFDVVISMITGKQEERIRTHTEEPQQDTDEEAEAH